MNYLENIDKNYNVGLYIRLSHEDDDKTSSNNKLSESESIINQKSLLLQYVKENNLSVYDIYIDDGYSGTNFDRPDFNRLIKDIESNKVNMVITKDMSRLGRDYIGTGNKIIGLTMLDGASADILRKINALILTYSKEEIKNYLYLIIYKQFEIKMNKSALNEYNAKFVSNKFDQFIENEVLNEN